MQNSNSKAMQAVYSNDYNSTNWFVRDFVCFIVFFKIYVFFVVVLKDEVNSFLLIKLYKNYEKPHLFHLM